MQVLALPSYGSGQKPGKTTVMAIVILIALFCGAMYMLYRMVYGFTKLLSNANKMKK